ncbi:MAG: taurine dioxygenase [Parasphingorhabdus sp.]|jgi:taurine dioxygenase
MNKTPDSLYDVLTPEIGVVISGINKSSLNETKQLVRIRRALDYHYVAILRDIDLTAIELKAFTKNFGPLFVHHADEGVLVSDGIPEVLEMLKEPDGTRLFGGSDWHADVTFRQPAGYVSILNAKIIPSVGGDTAFASTVAAFDALSTGMKKTLRKLSAIHSYNGPGAPEHETETAIHPVVRRHPVTGKEGLYINRMFISRLENMSLAESKPLIDFLDEHMTRPEFTFRHRWSQNDLILWDNRFSLHYPINDFVNQRRLMIRCTAMETD